ncbi:MAG: L-threonylcarbamoyladenylate synthase [Chitinophagaceae bacterium]
MLIDIHPQSPDERKIKMIVEALSKGAVIIYPTDTVYGIGCDIEQANAIERICRLKKIQPSKARLSFLCSDLSHLSEYTKPISTPLYRWLKQYVPGPYTFILEANKKVPKLLKSKQNTVGIRVPKNPISHALLKALGRPILSSSLPMTDEGDILSDADEIHDIFQNNVEYVINGGEGGKIPSTVVDCISFPPEIIRAGKGDIFIE